MSPTTAIVDDQTAKYTEEGISGPSSHDARKEIRGKKRHVRFDTQGLLMYAASLQDRDGNVLLISPLSGLFPFLLKLYAGSGY